VARYSLTLNTAPTVEPVTVGEIKAHLRIDHGDQDDYLETLITAARQACESATRRALVEQTWKMYLDAFPAAIRPPRPPLRSVSSLQYVDTDGNTQTLDSGQYDVDTDREPGEVREAYGCCWPSTRDHPNAVIVTFKAGYGTDAASVPAPVKHAIKLLAAHLYEHPESVVVGMIAAELPQGVEYLLAPYRAWGEQ